MGPPLRSVNKSISSTNNDALRYVGAHPRVRPIKHPTNADVFFCKKTRKNRQKHVYLQINNRRIFLT